MMSSRREIGERVYREVMLVDPPDQASVFRSTEIEHVFAEVWTRGVISRKDRRWITLCCLAARQAAKPLRQHMHAALRSGDISVDEMMEAANHYACYGGMARGDLFDDTLWDVAAELGMKQTGSIDPSPLVFASEAERLEAGAVNIKDVMRPSSEVPLAGDNVPVAFTASFVFADTWGRGGLTRRERRLITLTCAAMSGVPSAPVGHWNAGLASGDLTIEELSEFWVHFHTYGGGPQTASLPTP